MSKKCDYCDLEFSKSALSKHLRSKHADQMFQCSICDALFPSERAVVTHARFCGTEKGFCGLCYHSSSEKANFTQHVDRHPKERAVLTSAFCSAEQAENALEFLRAAQSKGVVYVCGFDGNCGFLCRDEFTLAVHDREVHGIATGASQRFTVDKSVVSNICLLNLSSLLVVGWSGMVVLFSGIQEQAVDGIMPAQDFGSFASSMILSAFPIRVVHCNQFMSWKRGRKLVSLDAGDRGRQLLHVLLKPVVKKEILFMFCDSTVVTNNSGCCVEFPLVCLHWLVAQRNLAAFCDLIQTGVDDGGDVVEPQKSEQLRTIKRKR